MLSRWLLLVGLVVIPTIGLAASENVLLNASVGAFYDSNRFLVEDGGEELNGTNERARIRYEEKTEKSSVEGELYAVNEQLSEFKKSENDTIKIGLSGDHQWEYSNIYGSLGVQSDSTLSTEVQAAGVIEDLKDRIYSTASAGYGYSVTERDQLNLGISVENANYDDIRATQLAEYIFYGANAGYTRSLTEVDQVQISLYENVLKNHYSGLVSDTYGVRATWNHRVTPVLKWKAGLGLRESNYEIETDYASGGHYEFSETNRSRVTDFELSYDSESTLAKLFGSYDIVPSSNGSLVARRSVGGSLNRGWSLTQSASFNLTYWEQRSDLTVDSGEDLDSLQATIEYDWRFFRKMNVVFRYSKLERLLIAGDVRAGTDFVGIEIAWIEDPISF